MTPRNLKRPKDGWCPLQALRRHCAAGDLTNIEASRAQAAVHESESLDQIHEGVIHVERPPA